MDHHALSFKRHAKCNKKKQVRGQQHFFSVPPILCRQEEKFTFFLSIYTTFKQLVQYTWYSYNVSTRRSGQTLPNYLN
jgi:hypothetical protein